jgi:hypothetical protein
VVGWHKGFLQNKLRGTIVVSGDGQCDSPGYSAKNLCYFLMEMETDYIIDLQIADKRQTDLKSVNMEHEALNVLDIPSTAISIKVVHEQSGKVEYERERLLGTALKIH